MPLGSQHSLSPLYEQLQSPRLRGGDWAGAPGTVPGLGSEWGIRLEAQDRWVPKMKTSLLVTARGVGLARDWDSAKSSLLGRSLTSGAKYFGGVSVS